MHVWGTEEVLTGFWWRDLMTREPLGTPRHRWECNIKMDLQEVGWGRMDWIDLVQDRDRFSGCCECGNEPSGSIK